MVRMFQTLILTSVGMNAKSSERDIGYQHVVEGSTQKNQKAGMQG